MPTYKCENRRCGEEFEARKADRDRGWARYCCKSCKAVVQEKRTGQHAAFKSRQEHRGIDNADYEGAEGSGWDEHKAWL
jgi:hypothetical protein